MPNEILTTVFTQHTVYLQRIGATLGLDVIPYLKEIDSQVQRIFAKYEGRSVTKANQSAIQKQINELSREQLQLYVNELKKDIRLVGFNEGDFAAETLNAVVENDDFNSTSPSAAQVNTQAIATPIKIGDNAFTSYNSMMSNYWQKWTAEIDGIVMAGFSSGQTINEVSENVYRQLRLTTTDTSKNTLTRAKRSARQLAITGTNHYANQARVAFVDVNDNLLEGYRFLAVLDSRTSQQCFTGETTFHPIGELTRLYRAKYSGEIITLDLSTGEKLGGTPNHPVLTNEGWTPLGEIDPSKHVLYSVVNDGVSVMSKKNIDMPTTFAEFFDSFSKLSVVDSGSTYGSAEDFYGDGVGINGKVDILFSKGHLRGDFNTSRNQAIKNRFFGLGHFSREFLSFCGLDKILLRRRPSVKTSKLAASGLKSSKKAALRNTKLSFYLRRPKAFVEHVYSFFFCEPSLSVDVPAWSALHESDLLKKICNGGSSDIVLPSDCGSGNTITVKATNIVGMFSEFRDCHVYTSECGQGYYTAGGSIVKNCRALDQRVIPKDSPKLSSFTPPLHPNCRSGLSYEVADKYKLDDKDTKRASAFNINGKRDPKAVSSDGIYYDKMKQLNASDQNDILGPTLGKAFRKMDDPAKFARMTIDSFGNPLTIADMKKKDNQLGRILRSQTN